MSSRRIFTATFVIFAVLGTGACAPAPKAPESNAPAAPPAETPNAYGQPGYQAAPSGGESAEPSAGLVPKAANEQSGSYATLADAEQALDQASLELAGLTGTGDKAKDKTSSTSKAPGGAAKPPAKPDATPTPLAQGDPRCERACKAFGSMRRAADGVCRLAGDADARCARARGIVKDNEARVAACKCDAGG